MNINIYKDYWLKSDELNIIVAQPIGKKDGVTIFKNCTYHDTITQALDSIAKKEINLCQATTIEGLMKAINKLDKVFTEIGKTLKEVK